MKFIYLGGSNIGGTHRVFLNLQLGLQQRGINLVLESGEDLINSEHSNSKVQAASDLLRRLTQSDGVLVNVFMAPALMNIARYLPPAFPRVMVVHSITHATYQAARCLRDHVHATIGVSPRIRDDLVRHFGFDPLRTHVIFNAVDPGSAADPSGARPRTAVLSLGRLEDASKGILQLPRIFAAEAARLGTLSIAGDGPDQHQLEIAFRATGLQPTWLGLVAPNEVAEIYARHAIFLFPSHFEGMGLALAEAMASGLAPIAARIRGVTDAIIENGVSGCLFEQGDVTTARDRLLELLVDDGRLAKIRAAAAERARQLFDLNKVAKAYDGILRNVIVHPFPVQWLAVENWSIPYRMQPGVRALIPRTLRRQIGNLLLRFG